MRLRERAGHGRERQRAAHLTGRVEVLRYAALGAGLEEGVDQGLHLRGRQVGLGAGQFVRGIRLGQPGAQAAGVHQAAGQGQGAGQRGARRRADRQAPRGHQGRARRRRPHHQHHRQDRLVRGSGRLQRLRRQGRRVEGRRSRGPEGGGTGRSRWRSAPSPPSRISRRVWRRPSATRRTPSPGSRPWTRPRPGARSGPAAAACTRCRPRRPPSARRPAASTPRRPGTTARPR